MPEDPAYVLFPSDAPAGAVPLSRQVQSTIEQQTNPASLVFPNESAPPPPETNPKDDAADRLFRSDTGAAEARAASEVESFFGGHRLDAIKDRQDDRAEALQVAGQELLADVKASGGLAADLAEAIGFVRENMDRPFGLAATAEQLQASEARTMDALAEEYAGDASRMQADLNAARRLIDHLEAKAPGTKASLAHSGAGNDPRLIRLAIKEARRRGL